MQIRIDFWKQFKNDFENNHQNKLNNKPDLEFNIGRGNLNNNNFIDMIYYNKNSFDYRITISNNTINKYFDLKFEILCKGKQLQTWNKIVNIYNQSINFKCLTTLNNSSNFQVITNANNIQIGNPLVNNIYNINNDTFSIVQNHNQYHYISYKFNDKDIKNQNNWSTYNHELGNMVVFFHNCFSQFI